MPSYLILLQKTGDTIQHQLLGRFTMNWLFNIPNDQDVNNSSLPSYIVLIVFDKHISYLCFQYHFNICYSYTCVKLHMKFWEFLN